ncbi:MAG: MmgE/PrpD family protein [Actinomycetota bacterium]|nr:MmgE/PrpD family protein [Actinomycetota bacterium]
MTAARMFAEWAVGLRLEDVPVGVQHAAKRHLLDGFGTALAAARLGEVPYAITVARDLRGAAEASIIGDGTRVSAPAAALANGALVHALDFDDTHAGALVHATAPVLASAFAVGQERSSSGAGVLAATVAGYETIIRLGAAVRHGFHARGFHATSVCGVFAAALIACKLMDLDVETTMNALGIAGSQAAGSLEFLTTGSSTKQLHPGFAAQSGILAARLAAAGASGPDSIFEGDNGLFRAYADAHVAADALFGELGERWETTQITIKPYPACQLSHASLDALACLLPLDASSIDQITFEVPAESIPIVCEPADTKRRPRTPYEGKFSLPYSAASLVIDGSLGLSSFEPGALHRADVLALADRVAHTSAGFDGPPAQAPGLAALTMKDGSTRTARVETSRGGPELPLSDDDLIAKFADNAGSGDLVKSILALEELGTVSELLEKTASR